MYFQSSSQLLDFLKLFLKIWVYFQTFIPQEVDKNEKSFGFGKKNLGSYTDIENKPWFRFPILKPNFGLTLLQSTVYCIHLIANNDGAG